MNKLVAFLYQARKNLSACYRYDFLLAVSIAFLSILVTMLGVYQARSYAVVVLMVSFAAINLLCIYKFFKRFQLLEQQQNQINEKLLQSNKLSALGEIVTGIAHEINNPLAIMYQEIQWIQHCLSSQDPNSIEEIKDSIQEVSRQIQRCREITHKLLDFARKRKPVAQPANLNEVIEEMVRLVELTTGSSSRKSIQIKRYYDPQMPLIAIDVPLIKQVILNLLVNAVQALGDKGGVVTVITRYNDGESVEFSIADTGCGIPPENLDKIFLPFFTTKPPGQGTGLGLSLSYSIVNSMGGTIDVESSPGKGSRFTVTIPLRKEGPSYGSDKGTTA